MSLAYDYYSAQLLYRRECLPGREGDFMQKHPAAWSLVREVMDMRQERDGG